ncbi:MAG: hypothetical protein IKX23_03155 [Treponema sp.]|nr:hypothetical protein [Treponema sp.]
MIFLNTFLYYLCFASAVLVYGIGIDKTMQVTYLKEKRFSLIFKMFLVIFISSIISWFVTVKLLIPIGMNELFPLISFLIYSCISTLVEGIYRVSTGKSNTEFIFSFLVVLLTVSESISLPDTIVISMSCIAALIVLIPIVYSYRVRILADEDNIEKYLCRLFLFLGILILMISVWDVMWMNPEVIQ